MFYAQEAHTKATDHRLECWEPLKGTSVLQYSL